MRKLRTSLLGLLFAVLAFTSSFSLSACSEEPPIPVDQFELMLTDIMVINTVLETNDTLRQQFNDGRIEPYESVFEQYGVTRAEFDSTISYYTRHTEEMDDVLDNLVTRLQHTQKELENAEEE